MKHRAWMNRQIMPVGGCWTLIILFNITIGALSLNYALASIIGRTLPWYGAVVGGLFFGEFSIPVAVIVWLLRLLGVHAPFVRL